MIVLGKIYYIVVGGMTKIIIVSMNNNTKTHSAKIAVKCNQGCALYWDWISMLTRGYTTSGRHVIKLVMETLRLFVIAVTQATKTLSGLKQKCLNESMVSLGASVSSLKLLFMSCLLMFNWPSTEMTWEGAKEGHEGEFNNGLWSQTTCVEIICSCGQDFF